jgi:predicted DCC family thiol-disulfide oxidoreductase YuxK
VETSLLIADGACGFCRRCVAWLRRHGLRDLAIVDSRSLDDDQLGVLGLDRRLVEQSLWYVDGEAHGGARAATRTLRHGSYRTLAGPAVAAAPLLEPLYRLVVRSRRFLPGIPEDPSLFDGVPEAMEGRR